MKNRFLLYIAIIGASLAYLHAAQVSTTDSGQKMAASEANQPLTKALANAVVKHDEQQVKQLLQQGAQPSGQVTEARTNQQWTPLWIALKHSSTNNAIIKMLIDADNKYAYKLFSDAIFHQSYPLVRKFIKAGIDVNGLIDGRFSPLDHALDTHNTKLVQILLDAGAQLPAESLAGAVLRENLAIAKLLIKAGANVHEISYKQTPVMHATTKSDLDMIRLLAKANANLNLPATEDYFPAYITPGDTLLMVAAKYNNYEMVETLLELGANPYYTNSAGQTVHTYAEGKPNVQKVLRDFEAQHQKGLEGATQKNNEPS